MIDKIFKIGILVFTLMFLFLYSQNVQKGRYYFSSKGIVFDTQTGKAYTLKGREFDPVSNKGLIYEILPDEKIEWDK